MITVFFNSPITKDEAQEVLDMASIKESIIQNNETQWFRVEILEHNEFVLKTALLVANMYFVANMYCSIKIDMYLDIYRR